MAWLLLPLVPLAAIFDWVPGLAAELYLGEIGVLFLGSQPEYAAYDAMAYFTRVAPEMVEEYASKKTAGTVGRVVVGGESSIAKGAAGSGVRGAIGKFIGKTIGWVVKAGRKIKAVGHSIGHTIKALFHMSKRDIEGIDELEPMSYDAAFYGLKEIFAEMKTLQPNSTDQSKASVHVKSLQDVYEDVASVIPGERDHYRMLETIATGDLDFIARETLGLGTFEPTGMTAVVTAVWPLLDLAGRSIGKKFRRDAGQRKSYPAIMMLDDTRLDDAKVAQLRVSHINLSVNNQTFTDGIHVKLNRMSEGFNEKGAASGCISIPVEGLDEPIEGCYIMVDATKADEDEAAAFQFLGSAILNRNERRWREYLAIQDGF